MTREEVGYNVIKSEDLSFPKIKEKIKQEICSISIELTGEMQLPYMI